MSLRNLLPIIFLSSFSTLAFEIVLTRIFSITLSYHFAFMIVSIAMLGLGGSGTVLTVSPQLRHPACLGAYVFVLGSSISASTFVANYIPFDPVALSWSGVQLLYIGLYYIVFAIPFFLTGLIIGTCLYSLSKQSSLLYGADLLGAATGSLGILGLMTFLSPEQSVLILSVIALISCFCLPQKSLRVLASMCILLDLGMLIHEPEFIRLRMSPYKGLQVALRYPGAERLGTFDNPFSRIDFFRSPAVRFAPGLSLTYLEPLPDQIGFSIDGGEVSAITSQRDPTLMDFLSYLPAALPYEIEKREDVLILDPQGGLQVLLADHYGAKHIDKVESTPFLTKTIMKRVGSFAGEIYAHRTWSGLGRTWLRSRNRQFDLIDLSLMRAHPAGSFGISEEYRFTVEAFKTYLQGLKPNGVLAINLFILPPPRTELRVIATVATALEELGLREAKDRVVAIRSWGSLCIVVKRTLWNPKEIQAIKEFTQAKQFDLVHYPGIGAEETNIRVRTPENEYFIGFQNLLNPDTRTHFLESYLFNVRPVYDERPFFNYYLRLKNLRKIYHRMGGKWQFFVEEGYLLPAVFVQVLIVSSLLILLPARIGKKKASDDGGNDSPGMGHTFKVLSLFACLGVGFMFVEIALIHRMILPLEQTSYAMATVLCSLLFGSGVGSLLSHRSRLFQTRWIMMVVATLIVFLSIVLPGFLEMVSTVSLPYRLFILFLLLFAVGLPMGIPFPLALKALGENHQRLIPWAWAVNGCFSVLAPLLAVMCAMEFGFQRVLWGGAAVYIIAFTIFSFPPLRSVGQK